MMKVNTTLTVSNANNSLYTDSLYCPINDCMPTVKDAGYRDFNPRPLKGLNNDTCEMNITDSGIILNANTYIYTHLNKYTHEMYTQQVHTLHVYTSLHVHTSLQVYTLHVHTSLHTVMYTHLYMYTHITCTNILTCTHILTYTDFACTHIFISTCKHIFTCTLIFIYTHI